MAGRTALVIELSDEERHILEFWQRSTNVRAGLARRGRMILLRVQGLPITHIAELVDVRPRHVTKWVQRFLQQRIAGLADKPGRGRKPFFPSGGRDSSGQDGLRAA